MIYDFSLFHTGLVLGAALVLAHVAALVFPQPVQKFLREFPRSDIAGKVLLLLAFAWCLWLVRTMDLGEFAGLRNAMTLGLLILTVLTWVFVDEFLSIRAFSILLLLGADVLLSAAFLQPPASRLWLVFLAYGWIFAGLFWAGLPWLLRDLITWATSSDLRYRTLSILGTLYGAAILWSSFAYYRV